MIRSPLFALIILITSCYFIGSIAEYNQNEKDIKWDYFMFVQLWPGSWIYSDNSSYPFTNNYFTIHGLWPEYKNGSWPQFCNTTMFNMTALDPIEKYLVQYWTDFKDPERFWEHEYYKHLSCLEEDDPLFPNEYMCFQLGLLMREAINIYSYLENATIVPSNTQNYTVENISNAIKKYINFKPVVTCDNHGILNEVRLCITSHMDLIDCPQKEIDKSCNRTEVWYNIIDNQIDNQ